MSDATELALSANTTLQDTTRNYRVHDTLGTRRGLVPDQLSTAHLNNQQGVGLTSILSQRAMAHGT